MDHRWFKGLKPEDKEARKKELRSYRTAFEALSELLEEDFEELPPSYDSPSWAYEQADRNGANRKLRAVLKLINTKE